MTGRGGAPARRARPGGSVPSRVPLLLASAAASFACSGAGTPAPVIARTTPGGAAAGGLRWVEEPAASASRAGAGAPVAITWGAGAPGDSLGGRAQVPETSCALFLAGGSASVEDLDLFVYGDDGAALTSDEGTDRSAAALLCPPHPAGLYAFARVAGGHGLVSLSVQLVTPAAAEAAARAAGAHGELAARALTHVTEAWPGLDESILSHRRELGGVWREVRRVAVPADPRVPTRLSVPVEPGQCVDAFIVPEEAVAFVELVAIDSAGRILGRAEGDTRSPSLVACARARADVTLELRPHAGRGLAAVVLSASSAPSGERPGALAVDGGATTPVATGRTRLAAALSSAGYGGATPLFEVAAAVGRSSSHDVALPAGCARLDTIGGAPLSGVAVSLYGSQGGLIARGEGPAGASLFACTRGETARLDVESRLRGGPVAVELRALPLATKILSEHPLAAGRLLSRLASAGRFTGPRDLPAPKVLAVSTDALAGEDIAVAPGHCATVAVALDAGSEGILLRALNADTKQEELRAEEATSASVELCATESTAPRRFRAEISVSAGGGTALFAVRDVVTARPSR